MEPLRQPVVLVEIEGDSITLNGALVDHTHGDPWTAAIAAVCATVAAPLGRPVWALVTETGGQTRVAVRPDGSVSHLEPVVQAPVIQTPVPAAPVVAVGTTERSHDELAAFLARSAQAAQTQVPRRTPPVKRSHRGPGRPHPVLRRATPVLGVAALVTVALAAALLLTSGGTPPQPDTDDTTTTAAQVKDVLPAAHRAKLRDRFPRDLEVHVVPHAGSVEVRVEATRLPVRAVIVLDPAYGHRTERRVTLHRPVTRLSLGAVPAGRAEWVVRVVGARPASGSVRVPEPPPAPATSNLVPDHSPPETPSPTRTVPSEPLTPIDPDEPTGPVDPDDL